MPLVSLHFRVFLWKDHSGVVLLSSSWDMFDIRIWHLLPTLNYFRWAQGLIPSFIYGCAFPAQGETSLIISHCYLIYWPHVMSKNSMHHIFKFTLGSSIHVESGGISTKIWHCLFILSSYLCVHLSILLSLSQFPALMPKLSWSFLSCLASPSLFLSPHLCSSPWLALPLRFPLFFPPLSPCNQTSGEECWVSTFPEKRTICATQRPTMDPLCSLLPSLCCRTAEHTCTGTCLAQKHTRTHTVSACCSPCAVHRQFLILHLFVRLILVMSPYIFGSIVDTFICMMDLTNNMSFHPPPPLHPVKLELNLAQCWFNNSDIVVLLISIHSYVIWVLWHDQPVSGLLVAWWGLG